MFRGSFDFYRSYNGYLTRFIFLDHKDFDFYLELGLVLRGTVILSPFVAFERQSDTIIHPYHSEKYLLYVGLKTFDSIWYR